MQPYQSASEETIRQGELPITAAKTVGSIAASLGSAYAGGNILKRVLPFLSKYIPEDLAIKGLSKIDPRFGKFISKALGAGKSFDEIKDFMMEKAEGESSKTPLENPEEEIPGKELAQFSPKLAQFIEKSLSEGLPIAKAAFLAKHHTDFTREVLDIEKNTNMKFLDVINKLYGLKKGNKGTQVSDVIAPSPTQPNQNSAQPQQGAGDQAIIAALQKVLQM